jgi:hypothetical protein
MNQLFTVFVKDANIPQIIQYYQIFIVENILVGQ